ncbi:MAG TPA: peroxidase family protein [Kofleriaceae bacterium]|nr:peroxidase family protein [Kofleriaceae bacterium]
MASSTALGTAQADEAARPSPDGLAVRSTEVRAIDGSNNNLYHPDWAATGSHLLREPSGNHYADGISAMARPDGPSPRAISNGVFKQSGPVFSHLGVSDFIWTFGQFLDHDLDLTEGNGTDGRTDAFIQIPAFDVFFDPFGTGTQTMSFHRGMFDPNTGTSRANPRAQINEITGYIDGSNVYGSDPERTAWLRTGENGHLKVTHTAVGDLAPFNDGTVPNAGTPERPDLSSSLFVAGDIRINEQATLAVMHIVFIREHNFQADRIASLHRNWTDEQIFQAARKITIAEIQHTVYDEFLPALLGNARGVGPYTGYDPRINAGVSAAFSTAAYRIGHTLLSPQILRLQENGQPQPEGPLMLRNAFFSSAPPLVSAHGIESFLRGVAAQKSQELDNLVIDDVRNFLFGLPGAGGLDLISLNFQRGRDMGLADFNTMRADFGLPKISRFSQITRNPALQAQLQQLFGNVNNIDPFAGLFAEDHKAGYNVGETLLAVFTDQFNRARSGDRFWYERYLSADDVSMVKHTKLSDIIKRVSTFKNVQSNVFFVPGFSQPDHDPGTH